MTEVFPSLYLAQCSFWEISKYAPYIIKKATEDIEFQKLISEGTEPSVVQVFMGIEPMVSDASVELKYDDYIEGGD